MSKNWHRWVETAEGDDQCSSCEVVVTQEAAQSFTLGCPAKDCASASNPDRGCVFVPGRSDAPRCIYCGAAGGKAPPVEDRLPAT